MTDDEALLWKMIWGNRTEKTLTSAEVNYMEKVVNDTPLRILINLFHEDLSLIEFFSGTFFLIYKSQAEAVMITKLRLANGKPTVHNENLIDSKYTAVDIKLPLSMKVNYVVVNPEDMLDGLEWHLIPTGLSTLEDAKKLLKKRCIDHNFVELFKKMKITNLYVEGEGHWKWMSNCLDVNVISVSNKLITLDTLIKFGIKSS